MTKTTSIDGHQFEFTNIPSAQALKLATKVGKFVGPILGKVSGIKMDPNQEMNPELLAKLGEALQLVDEDKVEFFRKEFAEFTIWVDNEGNSKPLKNIAFFEQCFQGNIMFMYKWMFEFAKVNFFNGMSF